MSVLPYQLCSSADDNSSGGSLGTDHAPETTFDALEVRGDPPPFEIPLRQRSVGECGREGRGAGESEGLDVGARGQRLAELATRHYVPEAHRPVFATRGEPAAVRAERDRQDVRARRERRERASLLGVPKD